MAIRNTLFDLWKAKELELGRELTLKEVADAIGVSIDTVSRAKSGKTAYPDEKTVNGLCKFFDVEAGPVTFIVYHPD